MVRFQSYRPRPRCPELLRVHCLLCLSNKDFGFFLVLFCFVFCFIFLIQVLARTEVATKTKRKKEFFLSVQILSLDEKLSVVGSFFFFFKCYLFF